MSKAAHENTIFEAVADAEDDVRRSVDLAYIVNDFMERAEPMSVEERGALSRITADLLHTCRRIVEQHELQFELAKPGAKPRLVA